MAVKEILIAEENDSDIATATKEVDLLRSLCDENIVKYLGSCVDNEAKKLFVFTEWVPGGNLEQNRKKFGGNETIVKRFTAQILRGVAYLHSKNIVHHDIKPSNILVDQHGVVKLAGFGASRLISSSTCVNNESMRGTPNYMAPEVIKQTSRSRKSDIWSVGCSVLRLLTGQPFWGDMKFDSQISLLYYVANLETMPPLPGELSDEARSFIAACLKIDPMLRPSTLELLQHPFVKRTDLKAPRPVRTSSNNNGSARMHTAPVDNLNRSKLVVESQLPAVTKRATNSAPPPSTHLPRIRSGAAAPKLSFVAPAILSNAFDLPGEVDEGETSIPNFSTTVFPLQPGDTAAPMGGISQKRQTPYLVAKQTSIVNATSAAEYTFSEFENGSSAAAPTAVSAVQARESPSTWEEQPILTDAARAERE
ncbi:Ste/ste11 protein kinase, partial [Globisporangium splendens]